MVKVTVKGHEFNVSIKDSFNRRSVMFANNLISTLRKIGLTENDLDIPLQAFAIKKTPASVTLYFEGHRLYYSYSRMNSFVENLYVVSKVIEFEVEELINGKKTAEEFILDFSEDKDIEKKRKEARETLGLDHDVIDIEVINAKYKILAREHHPDMPNGNTEKFKIINHAHKTLKRELE